MGGPAPISPTQILAAIERAHRLYFRDADRAELFGQMLDDGLALTGCEYGFIGEVLRNPDGTPYLKTWAVTDIAWDTHTREFYENSLRVDGGLLFTNLDTLFGAVMRTGDVVISNEPDMDPRRGGLPPGHPAMTSFLGVPLLRNDEMIGMFGVANRSGGFSMVDVHQLRPYLTVCAHLIDVIRTDRERSAAVAAEREALAIAARQERLSHIGRLASSVAHDLNSLINVISLQCELLEMSGDLSADASSGISRIQEMCDRAAQMTGRLQRLRAPTAAPDTHCAVAEVVAQNVDFLRSVAGGGVTIDLESRLAPDAEASISDIELLQVLLNLVSNAGEAMTGRGHVAIVIHSDDGDIVIDVADDGPGVPGEVRDQVLTPFASTKGEGRGLGLTIVQSVLEANGGNVHLMPSDGGALFRVRIPQAVSVAG
jgi:signal transduction histidine kinase